MEDPMTESHIFWNPRHLLAALALGLLALLLLLVLSSASAEPDGSDVPLSFTPNAGQTDEQVRYLAQGEGYAFFFTDERAVLSFAKPAGENQAAGNAVALDLRFVGMNPAATLEARERAAGTLNRLTGECSEWKTDIPTYEKLVYRELWPGIDMVIRGAAGELKYEFHVSPGADARDIRLAYGGADGLSLADEGSLSIATAFGELTDAPPVSYQRAAGERVPVETAYTLDDGDEAYGFTVGSGYDPGKPLVIDPSIDYSTFLGGAGSDAGRGIAVDARGNAYVTGQTASLDFPTTVGAFDQTHNLNTDVFVTKLNSSGSSILWSTFVGGSAFDSGNAIAVDAQGAAYVSGFSGSLNYPTTAGAFDRTQNGGSDAFVTKLDPSGSALAYSTYLGGAGFSFEGSNGIAVDDQGSAYVTGFTNSAAFPTTPGAHDTTHAGSNDVYVTKLDSLGSALVYSTLLGGSTIDTGNAITLDAKRNAYVTGFTASADFPTTPGGVDMSHNGSRDAFVAKLDATGSTLAHSTFLGGTANDSGTGITVDAKRQVAYRRIRSGLRRQRRRVRVRDRRLRLGARELHLPRRDRKRRRHRHRDGREGRMGVGDRIHGLGRLPDDGGRRGPELQQQRRRVRDAVPPGAPPVRVFDVPRRARRRRRQRDHRRRDGQDSVCDRIDGVGRLPDDVRRVPGEQGRIRRRLRDQAQGYRRRLEQRRRGSPRTSTRCRK
jgi:hypothetical protein